jgi:hypothetical protein
VIEEIWKPVPQFESLYKASNLGNVKSMDRLKWNGKCFYHFPGRMLKGRKGKGNTYYSIYLIDKNRILNIPIHQVILRTFKPPKETPSWQYCANHIDGCKTNNCINNLEWTTKSEDVRHAYKLGLRPRIFKKECKWGHKFSKRNTYVSPNGIRQCILCAKWRKELYR